MPHFRYRFHPSGGPQCTLYMSNPLPRLANKMEPFRRPMDCQPHKANRRWNYTFTHFRKKCHLWGSNAQPRHTQPKQLRNLQNGQMGSKLKLHIVTFAPKDTRASSWPGRQARFVRTPKLNKLKKLKQLNKN